MSANLKRIRRRGRRFEYFVLLPATYVKRMFIHTESVIKRHRLETHGTELYCRSSILKRRDKKEIQINVKSLSDSDD